MKKSIYLSVIALFLLIAIISGMMIYAHFKEANTQDELYESIATVVERNTESTQAEPSEADEPEMLPEYAELYKQNSDIVGWITIPDTKINYPVMQSPDNPSFYLKHGFDKGYTDYGCPYVSRIHYRTAYQEIDDSVKQYFVAGYEDSICPKGVAASGKAAYVERNRAMIRDSDVCVFYYDEQYQPNRRKMSKCSLTDYQPQSGTRLAFD